MSDTYTFSGLTYRARVALNDDDADECWIDSIEAVDTAELLKLLDAGHALRIEDLERAAIEQERAASEAMADHFVDVAVKERREDGR